jgi:hypothetical protein
LLGGDALSSVHAYADLVDVLWGAGDVAGALRLEALWHDLQRRLGFELLCGYLATGASS